MLRDNAPQVEMHVIGLPLSKVMFQNEAAKGLEESVDSYQGEQPEE